jgi:hypothetical protein
MQRLKPQFYCRLKIRGLDAQIASYCDEGFSPSTPVWMRLRLRMVNITRSHDAALALTRSRVVYRANRTDLGGTMRRIRNPSSALDVDGLISNHVESDRVKTVIGSCSQ